MENETETLEREAEIAEAIVNHDNPAITRQDLPMRHFRQNKLPIADAMKRAIDDAMENRGKLSEHILAMEGMSGKKYRYFINNLIEHLQSPHYLEVGSYAGSTLCSAIFGNSLTAVAVDNWSEFGGPVDKFFKNLSESCSIETKVSVVNSDFRQVNFPSLGKFNIYLFDGPHAYADHHDGLSMAMDCLEDEFIYIVDDWNWDAVRYGTMAAIADACLTVQTSIDIRTSSDNTHPEVACQYSDWHNGYFIALLKKK